MEKQILKFDPLNWDWYAFLEADVETKMLYKSKATSLSVSWVTCACGQLCDVLPKEDKEHTPLDDYLRFLGSQFHNEIKYQSWSRAKRTLDKIEARTMFLLQQPDYTDPTQLKY